jgi:hypothetical protein
VRRQAQASAATTSAYRRIALGSSAICIAAIFLAGFTSFALGAQTHPYTGTSFGPDGVGGTESFERVQSLAVDPANGDTYVYDGGTGKVYKFDSAGAPVNFTATGTNAISGVGGGGGGAEEEIALAPAGSPGGTAGDIYVANNGQAIHVYSPAGAELGELPQGGETCGVATDPAGNFYSGIFSSTIKKFTPSANPPTAGDQSGTGTVEHGICNVAADGLGNVYAASYSGNGLFKLEGIADATPTLIDPAANTMAIAPGSNDLYADHGSEVFQYDSSGTPIGSFGSGDVSESHGVAVNSGASKIYVGTPSKVKVFGPATTVPDAITEAADAITKTTATLHGTVGAAGGPDATCVFQYTSASAYFEHGFEGASEKPCNPAGPFSGSSTTPVSASATGLSIETEYRFRLLATSSNGSNGGSVHSFSTPGAVNVLTDPATNVTNSGATLNGTINPEGTQVEECRFEFGTRFEYESSVPCAETLGEIGAGNVPVSVHADLSGLTGGVEYQFRLVAHNELGTTIAAEATVKTPGPTISAESLSEVGLDRATFTGSINPNGEETIYRFEYVTQTEFETDGFTNATQVPAGGESIGGGTEVVEVEQEVAGLDLKARYHVRLVAESSGGTTIGEEMVFNTRSQAAPGLPDGRAYEQATPATPVEKNATNMLGYELMLYASPDGNATTYYSVTGAGDTDGSVNWPIYIARRGADNWSSTGFNPPPSTGETEAYDLAYREDLSGSYIEAFQGSTGGFYFREADGNVVTIASGLVNFPVAVASENSDLLLFESRDKLASNAVQGVWNLYLWQKSTNQITLVDVLADNSIPAEGAFAGPWSWVEESFESGGSAAGYYTQDTLSRDGSRVFFTTADTHQIYMRQDPMSSSATTTLVSASQKTNGTGPGGTDPNGPQSAEYLGATPDGSFVFFKSREELTNDANTGAADESANLYRYEVATGELIDLSVDSSEGEGARVLGLGGTSADGSYVYFVAKGKLAAGATAGEPSLYVWHNGQVDFVTDLRNNEPDEEIWLNTRYNYHVLRQKGIRVTPDGRTIAFLSAQEHPEFRTGSHEEIYRWEYEGNGLQCLSCDPAGQPASQNAHLQNAREFLVKPAIAQSLATRNLSPDGKRMFFSTPEALVDRDVNGAEDVYEWEAKGKGSCTNDEENGGCLYLISTGTSPEPSYFSDASLSGNDVFFFTTQQLVGQDKDELSDVYDARVDGGLASQNPVPVRPCEGEGCLGAGTSAGEPQQRGTSTFAGPGNERPPKKHRKKRHAKKAHHKKKQSRHGRGNR